MSRRPIVTIQSEVDLLLQRLHARAGREVRLTASSAQIAAIALSHYRAALHRTEDERRSFEVQMIATDDAVLEVLATAGNAYVAIAAYESALGVSSGRIVLRQGARVIRDSGPREN